MRKDSVFVLLVLTFLQTGRTNSWISVSQRLVEGVLTVTCDLLSEDSVNQINWERVMANNRTKLGILHPQYGTYIFPDYEGSVEIESSSSHHTTSLKLIKADTGNSSQHCCLFITFPSGKLEACADSSTKTEAQESEAQMQIFTDGWWEVMAVITIVFVLTMASLYLFRRSYGSRRQVFQVEQAFLTEAHMDSEQLTRELPQSSPQQEPSEAFDPSKLYAKIKMDYYYDRLWKAYGDLKAKLDPEPKLAILDDWEQLKDMLLDSEIGSHVQLPGYNFSIRRPLSPASTEQRKMHLSSHGPLTQELYNNRKQHSKPGGQRLILMWPLHNCGFSQLDPLAFR
ncbi:hypothetical protein AAFF_G00326790 [Aldrovandia affinis]|uniref:Transmembrane protein PVRIG immunoglobulin-like domain-containing protein n=1 Tax=Aldrovandia affinis TaxID=143900 RepID=A0AAD7X0R5_9TELE|nr:hypothetical protein AAFF_G00326790 [Aldrovandia affinis]